MPVILGTNTKANLSKRLAQLREEEVGVSAAHTFGIQNTCPAMDKEKVMDRSKEEDDGEVGSVQFEGPSPFTLPPGGSATVSCKVLLARSLSSDILMLEASSTATLPSGVLLQPMVIPSNAVNINGLTVLVQNESLR